MLLEIETEIEVSLNGSLIFQPKCLLPFPPIFINIMGLKIDKEEYTLNICPLLFACNNAEVILGFHFVHLWL